MKSQALAAMCAGLVALAGAWAGLAFAIGGLLPTEAPPEAPVPDGVARRSQTSVPLRIDRPDPCTGASITLDVTLSLDMVTINEGDGAQLGVEAALDNAPSTGATDRVVPIRQRFGAYAPRFGRPTWVHDLRAQLVGRARMTVLVVALEQGVDQAGQVLVRPKGARVACGDTQTAGTPDPS